jgi:hypothetical protein
VIQERALLSAGASTATLQHRLYHTQQMLEVHFVTMASRTATRLTLIVEGLVRHVQCATTAFRMATRRALIAVDLVEPVRPVRFAQLMYVPTQRMSREQVYATTSHA